MNQQKPLSTVTDFIPQLVAVAFSAAGIVGLVIATVVNA